MIGQRENWTNWEPNQEDDYKEALEFLKTREKTLEDEMKAVYKVYGSNLSQPPLSAD